MIGGRARWFALTGLLAALLGALWLGRGTKAQAPSPAPRAVTPPSQERRDLSSPATPNRLDSRSAPPQNSDDPQGAVATLAALRSTYAARSTRKPAPDAELERVLVTHLGSPHDAVVQAALETARVSLLTEPPQAGVVTAIVGLSDASQAVARRAASLEALNFLRPDRRTHDVLSALSAGLDAEQPELVSLALLALSQSGPSLEAAPESRRAELGARVLRLLAHGDPGVRGRALSVLTEVSSLVPEQRRYEAGKHALLDRDAYVVAQAADLLARCERPAAVHRLIAQARDLRPARYELRPYQRLDGSSGVLVHEVPGRRTVAEAMLFAVRRLGELQGGLEPLLLTLRDRHTNDQLLLENAGEAHAWYLRNRAKLPRE